MLENSQLLCLRPVEILNPIKFEAVVLFINTAEGKQRNYLLFIYLHWKLHLHILRFTYHAQTRLIGG